MKDSLVSNIKKIKILKFSIPYTTYQASVYQKLASKELEFHYITLKKTKYWTRIPVTNSNFIQKEMSCKEIPIKKDVYGTYKEYFSFDVIKYLFKIKPDIFMLAPELGLSTLYILLGKLAKAKIIGYTTTIPNIDSIWGKIVMLNFKINDRLIDHYIIPSLMKKKFMVDLGIKEDKITNIGHGVDIEKFSTHTQQNIYPQIPENKKILLSIGVLTSTKGKEYLIESVKELTKNRDDVFLVIIGKGKDKEKILKMVKELKLEDHVLQLDHVNNSEIQNFYSIADLVIITAINKESFGPVYLEGMSSGKPILAFKTEGCDVELIDNNKNGVLIRPKDTEMLTLEIDRLLSNDKKRLEMGQNARRFIEENYSFEALAKKWRNVLYNITSKQMNESEK